MTDGAIGGSTIERELADLSAWPYPAPAIVRTELEARLEKARSLTAERGANALIIGAGASLRYFAGISWTASERLTALLLPVRGEPVIIAPAFELGTLDAELAIDADLRLWEEDEDPAALVGATLRDWNLASLAADPAMAFMFVSRIGCAAPTLSLSDGSPIIDGCRTTKSAAELTLLQQAKAMTLEVHRRAARIMAPGISASEVRRFIDEAHRAIGAPGGSSFCIVQFGQSTAYPHGLPGESFLKEGNAVVIDTGCTIEGYHSDITRSYTFGEATDDYRAMWQLEKEAQQAAFDAVEVGKPCEAVDAAARAVLEKAGLGPGYRLPGLPHRTGHGIGLSIHEPPYLVRGDRTPLRPGMCFSNEPMIVVPDRFGIRLEDHFYVTEEGAAWFTPPAPSIERPVA